jgi:hypothetical protein
MRRQGNEPPEYINEQYPTGIEKKAEYPQTEEITPNQIMAVKGRAHH